MKYVDLDPQYSLTFLAKLKTLNLGAHIMSFPNKQIYDRIKWVRLSTNFYSKLDTFLAAYKELFGDIARLPPLEMCNKSDQSKRGGWRIQKCTVRWIVPSKWREHLDLEVANDPFGRAFGHVLAESE